MPAPNPAFSQLHLILCIVAIFLTPLAGAGLSLINTGLARARNAAHVMLSSLCVMGVAAVLYFVCGFSWQGYFGQPAHSFTMGNKAWDWIAAGRFFMRGMPLNGSPASLAAWFSMIGVGIAAVIPLGAAAERWRLTASCASAALLGGWTFPLFAHWVWGGGWLAQLGVQAGLGQGFLDAGGASTIHVVGGLTALSMAWILGPRRAKYSPEGVPAATPGHNSVYVLLGCLLAFLGWLGLNSAGALLFQGVEPGRLVLIGVNTTLAAGSAALMAAWVTGVRFGKPDASLSANGWVGGLVASSAVCAFVPPAAALLTGLIAGALVPLAVGWLELRASVDDPGGAISVHAVAGIWGLLAVGLFAGFAAPVAPNAPSHESGQFLAQVIGIATLLGFVLPMTYGLNWLLNRFYPQRASAGGEEEGMDLHELGGGAYPEFNIHPDEFLQR